MIGPFETLFRVAFAAEEPDLPGIVRCHAGEPASSHWSDTGMTVSDVEEPTTRSTLSLLIRLRRYLGGAIGVRLTVFVDDLDGMFFTRDDDAVAQGLAHARQSTN